MSDAHDKRAPERLMTRQDIGEVVRFAAEEPFPVDRLEENERVLLSRLDGVRAREERWIPHRRLLRVAVATGMMVGLFSVGASALLVYHRYFQGNSPAVEVTKVQDEAAHPSKARKKRDGKRPDVEGPVPEDLPNASVSPTPRVGRGTAARHDGRRPAKSVLDAQLALFNGAKKSVSGRDYRKAISKLDLLDREYPGGPLAFESKELRARCLFHMGSLAPAEKLVGSLVLGSRSNRKRAELMRFLGDIQVRRGHCPRAVETYRRALGLGLREADSRAAKNGIASCAP